MDKKCLNLYVVEYKSARKLDFTNELQNLFKVTVISYDNGIKNRSFQAGIRKLTRPILYKGIIVPEKHNSYYNMSTKQDEYMFLKCISRHPMRTKFMLKALVDEALKRNMYSEVLSPENNEIISNAALFHDLGKIKIPPHILSKPGKLTQDEYEIIKTHTTIGENMILSFKNIFGYNDKQIQFISEIIYSHHERWDGSGYPQGIKGEKIPVSARLMAVADVYDAMTSKRIYKEAYSHKDTVKMISKSSGTHFDPQAVELFLALQDVFNDIALSYGD